jgi:hypothetical protein
MTTYKEPRQNVRSEDLDEVPGEVQTAFFEDLAKTDANEQIIVLENKQPPASIKEKSTYTEFVGYEIPGRSGFFPVAKKTASVTPSRSLPTGIPLQLLCFRLAEVLGVSIKRGL